MPNAHPLVLIADDYPPDREAIERKLPAGYERVHAASYAEAAQVLRTRHVHLAIVDLFLDEADVTPYGLKLLEEFPHVPILLMTGKTATRTDDALRSYDDSRLHLLNKDADLAGRDSLRSHIDEHLPKHYNLDLAIDFRGRAGGSWLGIANHLHDPAEDGPDLDTLAAELEDLVRKAFCRWDESGSDHIRAARVWFERVIESSDNSVVLQAQPVSARNEPQAEVVLKISKASHEHSKFGEYRNVLGGYGLREWCYQRTCHLHAQVYAVPYYTYDQTGTYAEFYRASLCSDAALETIEHVTRALFADTLGHLARRVPTSRGTLRLSDYYRERIKADKRAAAILEELGQDRAPLNLAHCVLGDHVHVRVNGDLRALRNPVRPVLIDQTYRHAGDVADTALRHGDLHAGNVLVDPARVCCWYIDYESFDVRHFALVDHVELEASVLFRLMKPSEDPNATARLIDALTPREGVGAIRDIGPDLEDAGDACEARKAFAAIKAVRASAERLSGPGTPAAYYHALLYEALRAAGKQTKQAELRWHALIAAAVLFDKLEALT